LNKAETIRKPIQPKLKEKPRSMKKLILAGVLGVFALGFTSCGGGHVCDAYRTSDYTKYKADQNKKIEMVQSLTEATK
jgi:hypothetical protein